MLGTQGGTAIKLLLGRRALGEKTQDLQQFGHRRESCSGVASKYLFPLFYTLTFGPG